MKQKSLPKRQKDIYSYKSMRGSLGAGTAYVVMIMLVVLSAGSLMVGNIIPTTTTVTSGQTVVITTNTPEAKKSNLQLYFFPGATYTPTPTPTTPPQPQMQWPRGGGSGGGGGTTCFPAGTKILMADMSEKNIEDVTIGDKVMGHDGKKHVPETVLALESPIRDHLYELRFSDGSTLQLTNEHPLYTTKGWKAIAPEKTRQENPNLVVGRLYNGDAVLHKNDHYIKIVSITYIPGDVQTYNLKQVTANNNFFADGFLAHNKGGGGGAPAPVGAR